MIQWYYGVSLSGLTFPLTTASGTMAGPYDTQWLSGMIFKDGASSVSLGKGISGLDTGWYTIAEVTATHMACHSWAIKVTANSGCLPQTIMGTNLSGIEKILGNTSNLYAQGSSIIGAVSGLNTSGLYSNVSAIMGAVSGLNTSNLIANASSIFRSTSGIPGIAASISGLNTSALIAQGSSILAAVSSVPGAVAGGTTDTSGVAAQVWATVRASFTSTLTFGGAISLSGSYAIISGLKQILDAVSGLNTSAIISQASSILTAVSAVPGAVAAGTTDLSGVAAQVWATVRADYTSTLTFGGSVSVSGSYATVSGLKPILDAVSGLNTSGLYPRTSGIPGIAASVSGLNTSAIIGNTSAIMGAVSGLHTSGLYFATSGIPGIAASVSGLNTSAIIGNTSAIMGAVSGLNTSGLYSNVSAIIGAVSGLNTSNLVAQGSSIFRSTSGIPGIATNVSNIGDVKGASVSGTLNYDLKLVRDMILPISSVIDKRYTPYRWYVALTGDGNTSSYWELADDANTTARGRIA